MSLSERPMTHRQRTELADRFWPSRPAREAFPLGRRWVGVMYRSPDGVHWCCEVAAFAPKAGYTLKPELSRVCDTLSGARSYMHELGRAVFSRTLPVTLREFGLHIEGVQLHSPV